jgi:hypothetical protein
MVLDLKELNDAHDLDPSYSAVSNVVKWYRGNRPNPEPCEVKVLDYLSDRYKGKSRCCTPECIEFRTVLTVCSQ